MTEINNPAGRLLNIVNAGKQKPGEKQAAEIWADLLSVPIQDKSLLLRRVGHVMALPFQIRERFEDLVNLDQKIYLKWLPNVEVSFSMLNFKIAWKQFIERFDPSIMYGMEICSDLLSRESPEQTAEENLLADLKNIVEELLQSIESEELAPDLRVFIYEHLIKIKYSIEEYQIQGITPLKEEFQSIVGSVTLNPELYKKSQDTKLGRKFWEAMGKLALVVTVTVGVIQIGKDTISLLPSGESSVEGEVIQNGGSHDKDDNSAIEV